MPRDAMPRDVAALADLAAESYRVAFKAILEPEALARRDAAFFAGYFEGCLPMTRVAEADGAVAGFTRLSGSQLDMLFVAARFQGRGLGDALLADAEARGARRLEAFTANIPARRFYEKRGWRATREYERAFVGRIRAFVLYEKGGIQA